MRPGQVTCSTDSGDTVAETPGKYGHHLRWTMASPFMRSFGVTAAVRRPVLSQRYCGLYPCSPSRDAREVPRRRQRIRAEEAPGGVRRVGLIPLRRVEPQAILDERPADRSVHVEERLQARRRGQAQPLEPAGEVAGLQPGSRSVRQDRARKRVAAGSRNRVARDADRHRVAALSGQLHVDFVVQQRRQRLLRPAAAHHVADAHAVDELHFVVAGAAVRAELRADRGARRAADVLAAADGHAGHHRRELIHRAAVGNGLDDVRRHGPIGDRALHVDERRLARHRHGLGEPQPPLRVAAHAARAAGAVVSLLPARRSAQRRWMGCAVFVWGRAVSCPYSG